MEMVLKGVTAEEGGGVPPTSSCFVLDLFLSAWVPAPGPVKSPHKFIKDENLFSI